MGQLFWGVNYNWTINNPNLDLSFSNSAAEVFLNNYTVVGGNPFSLTLTVSAPGCTTSVTKSRLNYFSKTPEQCGGNPYRAYPNPSTDIITLSTGVDEARKETAEVSIIDANDLKTIYSEVVNKSQIEIDVSKWPQGIYFLSINKNEERFQERILIGKK